MGTTVEQINIEWLIDPQGQIQAKSGQHLAAIKQIEAEYEKLGTTVTTNEQKTAAAVDAAILKLREQRGAIESVSTASRQMAQPLAGADERLAAAQKNAEILRQRIDAVNQALGKNVITLEEVVALERQAAAMEERRAAAVSSNPARQFVGNVDIGRVGTTAGQGFFGPAVTPRVLSGLQTGATILPAETTQVAAGLKSIESAGESAAKGMESAAGRSAQLRAGLTSLTRIEGIPGVTRGLRLLGSDAASMVGGFVLLEAAFIATKASSDLLQQSLQTLHTVEGTVNRGLVGSVQDRVSELRKLEGVLADINAIERAGLAGGGNELIRKTLAEKVPLTPAQQALEFLRTNAGAEFISFGATGLIPKQQEELVGIKNKEELLQRINLLREQEKKLNEEIAHQAVLDAARTQRRADEASSEALQRTFGELQKEGLKAIEQQDKLVVQADVALATLGQNPLQGMILEAGKELESFSQQFLNLPDKVAKASEQIGRNLRSNVFRGLLDNQLSGANLQLEIEKAKAGLPGSDLRAAQDKAEQDRLSLEKQISEARESGDSERLRQLQFQFESSGKTDVAERLNRDFRQRQLDIAQTALSQAKPDDRRFVLDKIIELTNQTGTLTQEQADLRLRTLEERFKIGAFEQDKSRVIIEIIDKSGGKIDSTVLGAAAPTATPPPTAIQNDPSVFTTGLGLSQNF